jgi:hypothetical protein
MLPAWSASLLPKGQASYAENGFLFSGELIGWRKPKLLRALANPAARMVYRVPVVSKTQARAYLAFILQPADGDRVTIGDLVYTFRTTLVTVDELVGQPFEVLIGTDTIATATHFANAITADSNESTNMGVQYGSGTCFNGQVKYFLPGTDPIPGMTDPQVGQDLVGTFLEIGAEDFGAAFNLIGVAESTNTERMKWLYDTIDFSHTTSTLLGGTNPSFDNDIAGAASWLEFNDPDTNVVKSPVVDDQHDRYYFASPSQMPMYNTRNRIESSLPPWLLGIEAPGCAPVVSVTGGGNNIRLGNLNSSGVGTDVLGNFAYLTRIKSPGSTQIQDVKFNTMPNDPAAGYPDTYFAALLYTDEDGEPGTLLNTGSITAGVVTDIANTSSFVNPTNLSADTYYWIGVMFDKNIKAMMGPADWVDGQGVHVAFHVTFTNGPPANIQGSTTTGAALNMWADLITSDVLESRGYVYTWVSEYGEEGPPSPPTVVTGWSNGVWTIDLWQPPANDLGIYRNLKKLNLYRTVPDRGGGAAFFFVEEFIIGTATYVDTIPNDTVALNDVLASTNWFPPPANLLGLTVMQNGMVAAFTGNEVWFCEPYRPHAWPPGYVLTVDFPIVGLGMTGSTLVVCTAAAPYVINGMSPSQLNQVKCVVSHPCLSRASILGGDNHVAYMSPNGLIMVDGNGQVNNTTDLWITRQRWQQLVPQKHTRAILLASCYYCLGTISPDGLDRSEAYRGFTIELAQDNVGFSIWPHPGGHRLGLQILDRPIVDTPSEGVSNILTDPWTGIGIAIDTGNVYYFDFSDPAPELKSYVWRSRDYQQNAKRNYAAMKVYFTVPPNTPAQNEERLEEDADDPAWETLPEDRYGYIKTYMDHGYTGEYQLIDCREIRRSGEVLRIIDGFKADCYAWEILGRVQISDVQIGTSVKDLAQV